MTLSTYISNSINRAFKWGENDCLTFVSGGLVAQGLPPLPSDWLGGYETAKGAVRHYRKALTANGHGDIIEAMDYRFQRAFTLRPDDGFIAARPVQGDVLGVVFGLISAGRFAGMSETGLVQTPLLAGDMFWVPK